MANAKKKKSVGNLAFNLKNTKAAIKKRRRIRRARQFNREVSTHAHQIIFGIIGTTMLLVVLAAFFTVISTPERTVTRKVESLVTDYYENYFYESILTYAPTEKSLDEIMEKYSQFGFASITLDQLLLFDDQRHSRDAGILTAYCDKFKTTATIFPDSPYGRRDYHVKYNYSCEF